LAGILTDFWWYLEVNVDYAMLLSPTAEKWRAEFLIFGRLDIFLVSTASKSRCRALGSLGTDLCLKVSGTMRGLRAIR
jgi:hypothetical protein